MRVRKSKPRPAALPQDTERINGDVLSSEMQAFRELLSEERHELEQIEQYAADAYADRERKGVAVADEE